MTVRQYQQQKNMTTGQKKSPHKWTRADSRLATKRLAEGVEPVDIAKEIGCSLQTVYNHLRLLGHDLQRRAIDLRRRHSLSVIERIAKLAADTPIYDISEITGVSVPDLRAIARRYGIEMTYGNKHGYSEEDIELWWELTTGDNPLSCAEVARKWEIPQHVVTYHMRRLKKERL